MKGDNKISLELTIWAVREHTNPYRTEMYLLKQLRKRAFYNIVFCIKNVKSLKTLAFDQTSYDTHPHLYSNGKHKGILKEEYISRRARLYEQIKVYNKHSHIVLVPSQCVRFKAHDVPYKFHQDTNFLYLSGYKLPDAILVVSIIDHKMEEVLFIKENSKETELWEGPNSDKEHISESLGIGKILGIKELEGYLNSLKDESKQINVWCKLDESNLPSYFKEVISNFISNNKTVIAEVIDIEPCIQRLRVIKSVAEQDLLTKSCHIASEAMVETIKFSHTEIQESLLESKFDFESRKRFATELAYPPVVAGADRACTIHYIANNQLISGDHMVLMDAGCEYQGYCSDITRTWPIVGKFNKYQREVYEALLDVQRKCIQLCKPDGDMSLDQLLRHMYSLMVKNYEEVHIIPTNVSTTLKFELVNRLCPHHIGHHLGLDVHDCSKVSRRDPFRPGMVVTVEPGFYVPLTDTTFPREFRGFGIRIEDDILIADQDSPTILTRDCPKSVSDIERLLSNPPKD